MTDFVVSVFEALDKAITNPAIEWDDLDRIVRPLGGELHSGATRYGVVFSKHKVCVKFAKLNETKRDYCAKELENYRLAMSYGVEKILLPIEQVGTLKCGLIIYVQPCYTVAHDGLKPDQYRLIERKIGQLHRHPIVRRIRNGMFYSANEVWIERATQIYGKRFMRSFEKWTHEAKVNDLHTGNIGYCGKQPVIFDYAGYWG